MTPIPLHPNLPTPTTASGNPAPIAQYYICPHCKKQSPLVREWVGLTDDELLEIYGWRKAPMLSDFIVEEAKQELLGALRKVEAKLKEKNT